MCEEKNEEEKLKEKNEEKQTEHTTPNQHSIPEQQASRLIHNQSPYAQNLQIQQKVSQFSNQTKQNYQQPTPSQQPQQIPQQYQQSNPRPQPQQPPPPLQPEFQNYQQQYPIQKLSTISQTGIIEIDVRAIETELNNLPDGWIVLLETSVENALDVSLAMIKSLTDKNYIGIILSASRPYENLSTLYLNNNIDMEKIFTLDLVSKSQSVGLEETGNVMYLENASALTNISIAIDECFPRIQGKKFIFIDSITTMLIHNKPDVFARFIHSILTKMRLNRICSLLISLENETNREVRTEISQLCDKILKI